MLAGIRPRSASGCAGLQRSRRPLRAPGRQVVRVTAWWSPLGKGSLDETDDEILTAAAVSKQSKAAQRRELGEARHGIAQPGGEDVPPTRQSLLSFATSLTFITAGAFFVGSMTRKYILQPPEGRPPYAAAGSGAGGSGSKGKGSKRGGAKQQAARGKGSAPSVQELVAQHGGGSLLASDDPQLASAALVTSQNRQQAAAAAQAQAAASAATAAGGAPSPEGAPPPARSVQPGEGKVEQHAELPAAGRPPPAGVQQQAAAAAAAADPRQQAGDQQAGAAPPSEAAQQQAQQVVQPTDRWCEATLAPAVAAADAAAASAAALAAAAPILDCGKVWILSRPREGGGSVALRLLFPVGPLGEEQNCVALLAAQADAEAAQRLLARLLGLQTEPQRVSAERIAGEAGRRRWAAAFYPAGSLAGVLAAVEDAAAQQEAAEAEAEAAAARGEQAAAGHPPSDPVELLQAVLQQQALLLSGEQMQAAADALEAAAAGKAGEGNGGGGGAGNSGEAAATRGAASPPPQQTAAQQAVGSVAQPDAQAAPSSTTPAAAAPPAAAAAEQQARAAWDPATERLPRRHEDPGWWLSLPVLHVPQLVYADGAKGLMSVPLSLPVLSSGQEPGGGGSDAAEARLERRLVAFEGLRDAEGLLECPLEAGTGAVAVQIVSVPPAQLAQHAATNGCAVAALPAGALSLPPGTSYDGAVAAVVSAVERQFYQQLAHAAGAGGGSSRKA